MNYEELLELAVDLAYQLQSCGAETYRVEESISRIFGAYGVEGEAFAIPNCIIASLETPDERNLTRMRRTGYSSTDMYALERYNALCRRICQETPPVETAVQWLEAEIRQPRACPFWVALLGYALAAAGFSLFFKGTALDALCGAACGVVTFFCLRFMENLRVNLFFKTLTAGFAAAMLAETLAAVGLCQNADSAIIGTLMLLVPGLLFTNSIRDIIYGDTMSGVNRLVQVLIIALALAVGVGAAVALARSLFGDLPGASMQVDYGLIFQCVACAVGSLGFCLLFNMRGPGILLCILGGVMSWVVYSVCDLWLSEPMSYLVAAVFVSAYAECMARLRKCPATPYLVSSLFPLIPGASIFYTMDYAIRGEINNFMSKGLLTAALAGALAVGVLLGSTVFRMYGAWKRRK